MHPDHIGGLVKGKVAAFPKAVVHIDKKDTDYWRSQANQDQAPDGAKAFFKDAVASVAPYIKSGKLATFEGSVEVVPGIRAVPIPGHTGGIQDTSFKVMATPC